MRENKMTNAYKSEVASKVAESVSLPNVSADRERQILGGVPSTPEAALDAKIQQYELIKKDIKQIGIQTPVQAAVYKVTDAVGITSPDRRIRRIEYRLESTLNDLTSKLNAISGQIDKSSEKHREASELMFDAGTVMNKYEAIERGLFTEMENYKTERAKMREELEKMDPKDQKSYVLQEALSDRERERAKIESDLDSVAHKKECASTAVKMSEATRNVYRGNIYALKQARQMLHNAKGKAEMKLHIFRQYIVQNPDNVLGALEAVRKWQEDKKIFDEGIKNIPARVQDAVKSGADIDFTGNDLDYKTMIENTNEMERNQSRAESENVREAKEILRKAWA